MSELPDSSTPAAAGAGRRFRLSKRREIARVFDNGRRAADGVMAVLALAHAPEEPSRLCVAVSSRHGKAAARNRVKRLCREAFRLSRAQLPQGFDFVVLPRPGAKATLERLKGSLMSLAERAAHGGDRT